RALPNARGPLPETDLVWTKALELAEKLNDNEYQLRAMWGLFIYRMYVGDFRSALALADKFCAVADRKGDAAARLIGHRLTGTALHYLGDQANARPHLERVISQYVASVHWSDISVVDHRVGARTTLSRILWMQGFPEQALRSARSIVDDARVTDHALSLCTALAHAACPIALYVGDLAA